MGGHQASGIAIQHMMAQCDYLNTWSGGPAKVGLDHGLVRSIEFDHVNGWT